MRSPVQLSQADLTAVWAYIEHAITAGDYKAGDVLGGKYTVAETLGRGSSGVTYKVIFLFIWP